MNLIKCANGHFYDASKFQQCPHCCGSNGDVTVPAGGSREQDIATVAADNFEDDVQTVAANPQPMPMPGGFTAPQRPQFSAPVQPVPQSFSAPVAPPPVAPPPVAPPPIAAPPVMPAPPVSNAPMFAGIPAMPSAPQDDDDDQRTIGIYRENVHMEEASIEPVVGWLVIINGKARGKSMPIKAGRNFIGRADTNDVVLAGDMTVSREKHAILVFEPREQVFLLQPGTSKELFYVNQEVVLETKQINAYDVLYIGKTKLIFVPFCGDNFRWEDTVESDD